MLMFYPGIAGNVYGGRIPGQGAAYVETLRKRAFQFVEQLVPFMQSWVTMLPDSSLRRPASDV